MKIGLNATCFNNRPSGANQRFIGIYGELIKYLPNTEFILYEPKDCRVGNWFSEAPNVSIRRTPIPSEGRALKAMNGFWYWGSALRGEKFDFFEGFNMPIVKPKNGQTLLTLHDIRQMYPNGGSTLDRIAFRAILSRTLRTTDHLITVSHAMKEDIESFYPETPISVIHNGVNTKVYKNVLEHEQETFRTKYALPSKFLLAVGHFEKRKNYLNLIDSIAHLHEQGRPCNLLIIGNESGEGEVIREKIETMNLSNHITILSGLSDLEVRCAYRLCSLFVFPSSYEGFGIPILEAMSAGCPMVLSDIPVFREITQNQGVYFPYNAPKTIASAIDEVLSSDRAKNRLIEYGNKRVEDFSFKKISMNLAQLYNSLL